MIFHSKRVSDIDFVPLVRFEGRDLSYCGKLSDLIVILGLIESQVPLLELLRDVTELVK